MSLTTSNTQFSIKLKVTALPLEPVCENIYLAGNFNGWNPGDDKFKLTKDKSGSFFIELNKMSAGNCEFKFTRGGWNNAEANNNGSDVPNRVMDIQSDTSCDFSIEGWKDELVQKPRLSTASVQVSIMDETFPIKSLGRTRRIWVYLPKEYNTSGKKYPVLYMHDGQNLFDNATAFAGEWGLDKTLNTIKETCIVVGIDNGGVQRMKEYNPNNTRQFGKAEGKAYLSFIVKELKPFIDKKYKTIKGSKYTYMAGSSMGGLISFYAGLYYPQIFGVLGILSPSFWIAPQITKQVKELANKKNNSRQKYFFYVGGAENPGVEKNMKKVVNELKKAADPSMLVVVKPAGKHNEATWGEVFPEFFNWIVSS